MWDFLDRRGIQHGFLVLFSALILVLGCIGDFLPSQLCNTPCCSHCFVDCTSKVCLPQVRWNRSLCLLILWPSRCISVVDLDSILLLCSVRFLSIILCLTHIVLARDSASICLCSCLRSSQKCQCFCPTRYQTISVIAVDPSTLVDKSILDNTIASRRVQQHLWTLTQWY